MTVTNYRHKDATPHMPAACSCSFYTSGRLGDVWETMAVLWGGFRLVLLGLPNSPNKPMRCGGRIGAYTQWTAKAPARPMAPRHLAWPPRMLPPGGLGRLL